MFPSLDLKKDDSMEYKLITGDDMRYLDVKGNTALELLDPENISEKVKDTEKSSKLKVILFVYDEKKDYCEW